MASAEFSFNSRRLSDYECVFDLLRTHGDGVICHVMIMRTKRVITQTMLQEALQKLVRHQPALRMRVLTEWDACGVSKRFVERQDALPEVTQASNPMMCWEVTVEEECSQPFYEPEGSLWKLLYMDISKQYPDADGLTYAIICKISNVIADHVSIYLMMTRQLRMILIGSQLMSSQCTICKIPLHLKPSVDQCFAPSSALPPVGKSKKRQTKPEMNCFGRKSRATRKSLSSLSPDFPVLSSEDAPRTRLCRFDIQLDDVRRMSRLTRKKDVNIQEVFTVAAAHAYYIAKEARARHAHQPIDERHVRVCHWLDLRRYHSAPSECDPLGMWLCPAFRKYVIKRPSYSTFWRQVRKLSVSFRQENEPWKNGFHEYRKCLDDVIKSDERDARPPSLPKCHVCVTYLEVDLDSEEQMKAMAKSRLDHVPDDFDPMVVDQYFITSGVVSHSLSLLNLSVIRHKDQITCVLSRDDNMVPFAFAEKFLAVLSQIVSNMVRRGMVSMISRSASYDSARLPSSVKVKQPKPT